MESHEIKAIAHQWFEAFNKHDLQMLLDLYDENAEHFSPKLKIRQPETNGLIKGKPALRTWWKDAFERLPTLRYEVITLISDNERVFMEYIRHLQGEEDMRIGEVLEVKGNLIVASRVYHG